MDDKELESGLLACREYRRKRFSVKAFVSSRPDFDGERQNIIEVSTNGNQWQAVMLYDDELDKVIDALCDLRKRNQEG